MNIFVYNNFVRLGVPYLTHCAHPPARRRSGLPGTACLVSSAAGAACPASGRVCRVLCGLPCIWHGLCCCLCCAVVPGALGAGVSTGGVYSRRPAPPGQSLYHRKNKKGFKKFAAGFSAAKNFFKKQKDPYKGSVFCAILALQALKGMNL